jgi:hypothetical protein
MIFRECLGDWEFSESVRWPREYVRVTKQLVLLVHVNGLYVVYKECLSGLERVLDNGEFSCSVRWPRE